MAVEAVDIWLIVLRWIHFFAGITWIGLLYYFNFVQVPTFKELDGPTKNILIPRLVKRALLWFRFSATVTVAAGWVYFLTVWGKGSFYDVTSAWWSISILAGGLIGTFMLINVWGVIWRYQKQIIAATEALAKGTPAPPDMPKWGKRALIASRMNVALSLPLLFFMAAATHLPIVV